MKVKLARVRVVFEEVECPEDCPRCGVGVHNEPKAVTAWHLSEFAETGGLGIGKVPSKGIMAFSELNDSEANVRIYGKAPICVRELRCARCGTELAALPIKVADVKEAAAEESAGKDLAAA